MGVCQEAPTVMLLGNVGRIEARSHSPPQNTRSHTLSQSYFIPVSV
ncbi:hypothetical protein [Coleofasciculus sp. F4-SAH-05]